MPTLTFLPLDLKGTKPSNRILNENRVLVKVSDRPHRVLIPRMGAFYQDASLRLVDNGRLLVLGEDYTTGYLYKELSHLAGKPIYALIVITNPEVSNNVTLSYQAVGGPFGLDVSELEALLDSISTGEQNRVDFEDIINKPKAYNPLEHMDEYWQLYGAENTVMVINRIADVIAVGNDAVTQNLDTYAQDYLNQAIAAIDERQDLLTAHLNDRNNPHQDTKATVGLDEIHNWPMASPTEHSSATINNRYTHPQGGMQALTDGPLAALQAHLTDTNNPHGTRYSDIEAYSTQELNDLFAQKLDRQESAYDSDLLFGMNTQQFKEYAMAGLSALQFSDGLIDSDRLGTGNQTNLTLLMGGGTYQRIQDLITVAEAMHPGVKILSIRSSIASTSASAIQHANATFGDLSQYPTGTLLIYHALNTFENVAGQFELKMLVRNTGGWAVYIP